MNGESRERERACERREQDVEKQRRRWTKQTPMGLRAFRVRGSRCCRCSFRSRLKVGAHDGRATSRAGLLLCRIRASNHEWEVCNNKQQYFNVAWSNQAWKSLHGFMTIHDDSWHTFLQNLDSKVWKMCVDSCFQVCGAHWTPVGRSLLLNFVKFLDNLQCLLSNFSSWKLSNERLWEWSSSELEVNNSRNHEWLGDDYWWR
jgi:hypothetical protein